MTIHVTISINPGWPIDVDTAGLCIIPAYNDPFVLRSCKKRSCMQHRCCEG